jgi:hypothetical protein
MWEQMLKIPSAVNLDARDYQARMYKGIKMINTDGIIQVYSAETEFYTNITSWFASGDEFEGTFMECVNQYLKDKYIRKLDNVEQSIMNEINSSKNHKRVAALKVRRTNLLNRYNEISTKETAAG